MADLVIPDEAKLHWAQAQIDDAPTLSDCFLRLTKTAIPIDRFTTLAELEAVQCDYVGYTPIQLTNWSDAVIVESAAMTEADVVSFQADEEQESEVMGCYATNGAGDKLWFASSFPAGIPTPFHAELQVSLQLDLASIIPS